MKSAGFELTASAGPSAGGDRQVPVVENEPDQRRQATSQLQAWGYTPLAAESAEEALGMIEGARLAFSLVAFRLPGLSGIEFLRRAAEVVAEAGPVIMIVDGATVGKAPGGSRRVPTSTVHRQ